MAYFHIFGSYLASPAQKVTDSFSMYIIFFLFFLVLEKDRRTQRGRKRRSTWREAVRGVQASKGTRCSSLLLLFIKGTGDSSILQHAGSAGSRRASRSHSHIPVCTHTNGRSHSHLLPHFLILFMSILLGQLITLTSQAYFYQLNSK